MGLYKTVVEHLSGWQSWLTILTLAIWSSQWVSEIPSGIPTRVGECFQSSFRTEVRLSESHIMIVNDCSVTMGKWALLVWEVFNQKKGSILTFDIRIHGSASNC